MKIPLIDLVAQYQNIREEMDEAIHNVLTSGTFILGPQVSSFEEEVAAYLGTRYAVGVASGTDALVLTLRALAIGPGDEVIVPAYTFFATAEAVSHVGATPVFVDIDPDTYCLDPTRLIGRITPRTKAVIPVHLFGQSANMDPILAFARSRGLKVVEDAAQAIGATYHGRMVGSLGDVGCLSFFPTKNLGAYGDGGMVVTSNVGIYEEVRRLRTHGWRRKYAPETIGYNSRLDELQAAILRVKLRHLGHWNKRRREIADQYRVLLSKTAVLIPREAAYGGHVFHLYTTRLENRNAVQAHLASLGIESGVYYPGALPDLQPYRPYRQLSRSQDDFPEARRAAQGTLAIPLYPEMTDTQILAVADALKNAVESAHSESMVRGRPR